MSDDVRDHQVAKEAVLSASSAAPVLALLSDPSKGATLRASSVLQRNTKLYGPMNALDVTNESTSWNSEGSATTTTATTLTLHFGGRSVVPTTIQWQFQAGFSAATCHVYAIMAVDSATTTASQHKELVDELELEDVHEVQSCELEAAMKQQPVTGLHFVFSDFADFYGRVILYQLKVWGAEN